MKKFRTSRHLLLPLLSVGLTLVLSFPLRAEPAKESSTEIVHKIEAAYEKVKDLEAGFTQRVLFKDFDTPFTSKGRVYLKRGKMRWDYQEPTKQQIFVDEEKVLYYVPEHRQVIKSSLAAEADSQIPFNLLSGTTRLSQNFDVSLEESENTLYRLELIPKDQKMRTAKIEIEVSPPTYLIKKITLHEANGNRSVFDLSDLKLNQGIKETIFSFVVPKGVEVVEPPSLR